MQPKLENFFVFLMVAADFSKTVLSFDSKCPPLRLVSGRSRYRWRGRSVRFNCMRGFQLVGVKYATCMNGKWDADVPICVKYGCRAPSTTHVNGQFIESYRGAVVKIVCNPGYTLIGSPSVYCNGVGWNETFPVCRVRNTNPALSCDFEGPDLCGWNQDPMHDFDWKRQNGSTDSGDVSTGPIFDHTREINTGHYMYMDSSNLRTENDTARLYSPVYPPEYSNGTCFKFWYRMHGGSTGYLKVYVKPEGVELFNVIPSFWINGDEGSSWIQSSFQIEPMESPFQIVIEGVRGPGAGGDTAFDDVKLASGDECAVPEETTLEFSSSVNPDVNVIYLFSCRNRCGQEKTDDTVGGTDDDKCGCYETCDRDGTCCSDYFDLCSGFPFTSPKTTRTDVKISSSTSPSPQTEPEEKQSTPKTFPKPSSPVNFNNESNEIDPNKPFEPLSLTTPSNQTMILKRFSTPRSKSNAITPPPEPEIPILKNITNTRVAASINSTKTIQRKIAIGVTKAETNRTKVDANATSTRIPPKEVQPKLGGKNEGKAGILRNASVTSSVLTTTARAFKNSKPNNIKKPSSSNLSNESRFNKGKLKEISGNEYVKVKKSDEHGGGNIRGVVEVGGTALAILITVIFGVLWYRRRIYRNAERENMVEDSDVRFLTSDEALDFTLARPADDDL